jgi:hypothetical protein
MNTIQLTLLWYGALTVIVLLLPAAIVANATFWYLLAVIIALTALSIYSFSAGVKASRRWVATFVVGPFVLMYLFLYAQHRYHEWWTVTRIRADEVTLTDAAVATENMISGFAYSGRLKNGSGHELHQVTLEFVVKDSGEVIERVFRKVLIMVPPGEARVLNKLGVVMNKAVVDRLFAEPRDRNVSLDVRVVGTRADRPDD